MQNIQRPHTSASSGKLEASPADIAPRHQESAAAPRTVAIITRHAMIAPLSVEIDDLQRKIKNINRGVCSQSSNLGFERNTRACINVPMYTIELHRLIETFLSNMQDYTRHNDLANTLINDLTRAFFDMLDHKTIDQLIHAAQDTFDAAHSTAPATDEAAAEAKAIMKILATGTYKELSEQLATLYNFWFEELYLDTYAQYDAFDDLHSSLQAVIIFRFPIEHIQALFYQANNFFSPAEAKIINHILQEIKNGTN